MSFRLIVTSRPVRISSVREFLRSPFRSLNLTEFRACFVLRAAALVMTTEQNDLRIKFELAPDEIARLEEQLAGGLAQNRSARSDTLTSTYFDTDRLSLYEKGVAL